MGSGLADAAAQLSLLAQDAPEKLVQEIQLFWEEVELEADRLEHGDDGSVADVVMTHPGRAIWIRARLPRPHLPSPAPPGRRCVWETS